MVNGGRFKMSGEMKKIEPDMSFHKVKDIIQLRFMAEQAKQIKEHLTKLLESTWRVAPVQQNCPYVLCRDGKRRKLRQTDNARSKWDEKHWEEACYHKWYCGEDGLASSFPFRTIMSYQVMLRDTNEDREWGKIDLLGVSSKALPVVIELKSKDGEYLLRAVAEGVAYAVAVKKAWSDGGLRAQWQERLKMPQFTETLCAVPVVVAAPTDCWTRWKGDSGKRIAYQVKKESMQAIADLVAALKSRGYPVTFVELLGGEPADPYGLPTIKGVRTLDLV